MSIAYSACAKSGVFQQVSAALCLFGCWLAVTSGDLSPVNSPDA